MLQQKTSFFCFRPSNFKSFQLYIMQSSGESLSIDEEFPMMPGKRQWKLEGETKEQGIPWPLVSDQQNPDISRVDLGGSKYPELLTLSDYGLYNGTELSILGKPG